MKKTRTLFDKELHERKLFQLLLSIFSQKNLAEVLIFKGGTALYFFYGLPRLSVDLDFSLVRNLSEKEIENLYKGFEKILKANLMEIKDSAIKKHTVFFEVSYQPFSRKIKIEISRRIFPDKYEVKNLLGIPINVMKPECMFAHKLVALMERRKNEAIARDIFDLWFMFSKNWEPDAEVISARTGKNLDEILKKAIPLIEKFPAEKLFQGLGEILSPEFREFVKNSTLKTELLISIKTFLYLKHK